MTIAILCPTRGRPEQFNRMCKSAANTSSKNNIRVYPLIDVDGYESYSDVVDNLPPKSYSVPSYLPTCHKWNLAAQDAYKDGALLFMLGADDMVFCTPMWDRALLELYDNKPHVYHLLDSRDENGTPHPIVTREWIEAMGWFLPPIYLHWMVDSWTVEIAKHCGVFTHLKDYMLMHDKPSDRDQPDETHLRIRRNGWHGRDMWVAEKSQDILEMYKRKMMACLGK